MKAFFALAVFACVCVAPLAAADLRGRINGRHAYSPTPFPAARVPVTLTVSSPTQTRVIATSVTGNDGMYYFRGIGPGNYVLVVNNVRYPLTVSNRPSQDVAPILIMY